jgi:hypothetical protein
VTSSDTKILEILALSNNSGKDLALKFDFPELSQEATFTTVNNLDQGLLTTVVSTGDYLRMIPETMWDRTADQKITGPASPTDWQAMIANSSAGPPYVFRIRNRRLYIGPSAIASGNTVAFEYYSSFWCETSGGTGLSAWAADSNVGRIPENILELDVIWRWKQAKGFEYAEDLETAGQAIDTYTGAAGGRRLLILGGGSTFTFPINTAEGSWNL